MRRLGLEFSGPFAWVHTGDAEFIMDSEKAEKHGVYLWAVDAPDGFLVWYVGQTRTSFKQRIKEHFIEQMCGCYEAYDPDLLARDGGCHVPHCCIVPRPRILFNPAIYSEARSLYRQILVDDVDEILQNDL